MSSFKDLSVWQESILLAEEVYILTHSFPKKEQFGLADQLRRSAVSIASNIAEGHGRFSKADTMRFLYIARGSLNELETQMIIAHRIGYLRAVDT